jgi:DNA recombination protein RmuC
VSATIQEVEKERAGSYQALRQQVQHLAETQRELHSETANLVRALRAPQVRGRWGEIQLRRVVEMAGMLEHCDFDQQATLEGGGLRPDLVVRLPGGKCVVVDAKTPLEAFLRSTEAKDDATRDAALRDHARQVRDHMASLGRKSYWESLEGTPEFVVMFLPGETFFHAALQHDPGLIEFGVDQRVIVASPTTLIALLRAVSYGWQQEKVAAGAEEIRALGREMHDRLRVFAESFGDVGDRLGKAVEAYNRSVGSLEARLLPQARKFQELGVGSSREIPVLEAVEKSPRKTA